METQELIPAASRLGTLLTTFGVKERIAFGLLVLGLTINAVFVAPIESRIAGIDDRLTMLDRKLLPRGNHASSDPEAQLQQFLDFFKRDETDLDWLGIIYDVGEQSGLKLKQSEYRNTARESDDLMSYQMVFPVNGTYLQVTTFVGNVLNSVPIAALDQITFRRRSINDSRLDSEIRITLFYPRSS
jgi:hypothetical protein